MQDTATIAHPIVAPKKLIEVALPLDEINKAAVREKSIRHGHPSTLHLWWARRPLAAARAVLFAQMVNDPAWKYTEEELKKPQVRSAITRKRNELFKLLTQLVQWKNTNNQEVLGKARSAIQESWRETCEANKKHPEAKTLFNPEKLPLFHDPFAGGGSIPLEAQRLGLEAHATDLNPVAVLLNKAMIEIPPNFAGQPPVGPIPPGEKQTKAKGTEDWSGAKGLAEDVRRYGAWMREEAWKRIGHLYPKVEITNEIVKDRPDLTKYEGKELNVIAWLWARTVASPNPAAGGEHVPLVSSWVLFKKAGKEAWVEPIISNNKYEFRVRIRDDKNAPPPDADLGTKQGRGANFKCLLTGSPITPEYIKREGCAKRLGERLLAVVCEGERSRLFLSPRDGDMRLAASASPTWRPAEKLPNDPRNFWTVNYGLAEFGDLFTKRQLVALTTLSDLVNEIRNSVVAHGKASGMADDGRSLKDGGKGATAYGDAVMVYLALSISRLADRNNTLCAWDSGPASTRSGTGGSARTASVRNAFARQSLSMTWDFAEASPFSDSGGGLDSALSWVIPAMRSLPGGVQGSAEQADARVVDLQNAVLSTDPPYYDNIAYADLSDFFYVWIRRVLRAQFPSMMSTLLVPKNDELVATPYRHGGKTEAEEFFLAGMTTALSNMAHGGHGAFPVTIYYAFKQSETGSSEGTSSTGWETFLDACLRGGFAVTGTWPIRTELGNRLIGKDTNALASSIVLVFRPRLITATEVSRRDFLRDLEHHLGSALAEMTQDPIAAIAPVDLAQAAIGPGMAIFSKYKAVLEADGSPMSVHSALIHINKAIDDYFAHAEGDMDADTRFCIGWFQQYEYEVGPFGQADVLARAKGTSVEGVRDAGVIHAAKGDVRLLRVKEYPAAWDPTKDSRLPLWEACHQMCRALGESESEAGALLARMPDKQDDIRQLAYRLYTICERKGWAEDARAYNELVTSWPAIVEESLKVGHKGSQMSLI